MHFTLPFCALLKLLGCLPVSTVSAAMSVHAIVCIRRLQSTTAKSIGFRRQGKTIMISSAGAIYNLAFCQARFMSLEMHHLIFSFLKSESTLTSKFWDSRLQRRVYTNYLLYISAQSDPKKIEARRFPKPIIIQTWLDSINPEMANQKVILFSCQIKLRELNVLRSALQN